MNYQDIIVEVMLITEECYLDVRKHTSELLKFVWLLTAHYDEY